MYHNYANLEPVFIEINIVLISAISTYKKKTSIALNMAGELKHYSETKGSNKYPLIKNITWSY